MSAEHQPDDQNGIKYTVSSTLLSNSCLLKYMSKMANAELRFQEILAFYCKKLLTGNLVQNNVPYSALYLPKP